MKETNPYEDNEYREVIHDNNLMALHEFEKLCWQGVELGHITAIEAEEAIWSFIGHVEKPERLPGQIGSVAVQLTLEFE